MMSRPSSIRFAPAPRSDDRSRYGWQTFYCVESQPRSDERTAHPGANQVVLILVDQSWFIQAK
jgi:hypothetical protein